MDLKLQRAAAWCGVVWIVLFFGGFLGIARLIPPLSPAASADWIAGFLTEHQVRTQIGLAVAILVYFVALPFMAVICLRVRRAEGTFGLLTMCQVFSAVLFVPGGAYPLVFLASAAYRTDRSPDIAQSLSDTFWLMFLGVVGGLLVQAFVLALTTFCYSGGVYAFPRWYGYLNAWYVLLTVPASVIMLFYTGPLAWNGVFAFWVPAGAFGLWLGSTTKVMLNSISAEEGDAPVPARETAIA